MSSTTTQTLPILEQELDLNSLFNLNYSFELLKQIINALVLSNKTLNKRIKQIEDDNNKEKDNEKLNKLEERLNQIEKEGQNQVEDLKNRLKKAELKIESQELVIKEHSEEIERLKSKINDMNDKINELNIKINNIISKPSISMKDSSIIEMNDYERFMSLLESFKEIVNSKLNTQSEKIKGHDFDLDRIKKEIEELNIKSRDLSNNILLILDKIEELRDLIRINKNDQIESRIKKYIDEQLNDIINKLQLKLATLSINQDNISQDDMKLINDLLKRVIELENLYRIISNNPKIDELSLEINKIWEELRRKIGKDMLVDIENDINFLKEKNNSLQIRLSSLEDLMSKEINDLKLKIEQILSMINSMNKSKGSIITENYVDFTTFNINKQETNIRLDGIDKEIEIIKKNLYDIINQMKDKASKVSIKETEDRLNTKIDEIILGSIKKFADKNDTSNNFKLLDDKIKVLLEMKCNHKCGNDKEKQGDNWLLAKKPVGANWCASCESYIGDLKENKEFVPWQRWPNKDDKIYRKGNGFSRMLQLINFDQNLQYEMKNYQHNNFNGDVNINFIQGENVNISTSSVGVGVGVKDNKLTRIKTAKSRPLISNNEYPNIS